MKKREVSAIDSIYEILDRIKNIEDHYKVLNKQNALINNKLNKILESKKDIQKTNSSPIANSSSKIKTSEEKSEESKPSGLVLGNIKVHSTLLTPNRSPIPDVVIKIFDVKNSIIRNMLTDSKGYWEVRLPAGRYRVTMDHDNFKTIERSLNLDGKQKNVEVV